MTHPDDMQTELVQARISKRLKRAAKKRLRKHETWSEYLRRLLEEDCAKTLPKSKDSTRG